MDTDLHSSPSGWTHPNLSGIMDAPCNVRRLPFHQSGVATRQFAPLVASLTSGPFTPASQRSPPSWAWTPVRRTTPSPQYSPTGSAQPLNQDELRRQIDLLTQDQQQRYQNRSIQSVNHTNTITTVYKDGRPPSVHRTSSRSYTPSIPGTQPTPVWF